MRFTVKDFMSLKEFPKQQLLTKTKHLEHIEIRHISVIEMPVGDFVRDSEVVLTTAIGCLKDEETFYEFVKDISKLGASAIVFAFENDYNFVPSSVIKYAEKIGLPLLLLPWEYRFAEIIEVVLKRIQGEKEQEVVYWEKLQKKILRAFLHGKTLEDAAHIISEFIGQTVVITDFNKILLSGEEINLQDYELLSKISSPNRTFGYIFIEIAKEAPKEKIFSFEQYISIPLTLWFDREQAISTTKTKMVDDFIWSLIRGDFSSTDVSYAKAKSLGIHLYKPFLCIVGKIRVINYTELTHSELMEWIEDNLNVLQEELLKFKKRVSREMMITIQSDMLIIYLEYGEQRTLDDAFLYLDMIEAHISKTFKKLAFAWGISQIPKIPEMFDVNFKDAKIASEICLAEKGLSGRYTYKDTKIYRILSHTAQNADTVRLIKETLSALTTYHVEKQVNLLEVVQAYFKNDCNVTQTAKSLHLHRQSLIYRLNKIEELAHISLENHDDKFLMELCIRMNNYSL